MTYMAEGATQGGHRQEGGPRGFRATLPSSGTARLRIPPRTRIYQKWGKLRNVWRMFDDGRSGSVSLSEVQDIGQQLNPYPAPKFLKDP